MGARAGDELGHPVRAVQLLDEPHVAGPQAGDDDAHIGRQADLEGLGVAPGSDKCEAMAGLISEGQEIINSLGEPDVKDSALIAAAQRVEHYEIAGYGCARAFARHLGKDEIVSQLHETLRNEVETDQLLTEIAETATNPAAAHVAEK